MDAADLVLTLSRTIRSLASRPLAGAEATALATMSRTLLRAIEVAGDRKPRVEDMSDAEIERQLARAG